MKLSLHWPKFPVAVEDIAKGWELCYCVHWVQLKQMKFLTLIKDIQDIPLKANKNWKQVQKLMVYMNIYFIWFVWWIDFLKHPVQLQSLFIHWLSYYVSYSDDDMVSGTSAATTSTWGDCILATEKTNIKHLANLCVIPENPLDPLGLVGF